MYDVLIIGAGVSGCACARELSRFQLSVGVIDKNEDVCEGTSKANSGIVHAGFDAKPGTLKAKLNVQGCKKMETLSRMLDFDYQRIGSLVVCKKEEDLPKLDDLYQRGLRNGVDDLVILNREQLRQKEEHISTEALAALFAPGAGIVCPFGLTIALAENAVMNGVKFHLKTTANHIQKTENGWKVVTTQGVFYSKVVVNAAGVYGDIFHNLVSHKKIHIVPRKGEYCLLDKDTGNYVHHTIFSLPGDKGKGILVTPTVHGNLLLGPTAEDKEDKEETSTGFQGLQEVLNKCKDNISDIPLKKVITSFAGLRAHEDGDDFIIQEVDDAKGFIDCVGIESPGLTAAPAIGERVKDIVVGLLRPKEKDNFIPSRKGILKPATLSLEERNQLIQENPAYGTIVCRCEKISEGEILDSIQRPLGAKTVDGVKRRVRAGMGRCQGGFCLPKVMKCLARANHVDEQKIKKSNGNSYFLKGYIKDTTG